jgi:hypothetical protein
VTSISSSASSRTSGQISLGGHSPGRNTPPPISESPPRAQACVYPYAARPAPFSRRYSAASGSLLVDLGPRHPIPQARVTDTKIFRQLSDGFGPLTGQLNSAATELSRMRWRHEASFLMAEAISGRVSVLGGKLSWGGLQRLLWFLGVVGCGEVGASAPGMTFSLGWSPHYVR